MRKCHETVGHNGVKDTLTQLRDKYWLVKGHQVIKKLIKDCVVCRKLEGQGYFKLTIPSLPELRLKDDFAFSHCGFDFCGPLFVKPIFMERDTDPNMYKVWICLFTCASSRGVHIDLVPDLTVGAFVRCLKRFVNWKGLPYLILSDNDKTFKGKELKEVLLKSGINWRFNLGLLYFAQDAQVAQVAHWMCHAQDCTSFPDVQYLCKIVLLSPMLNICARFAQDCTYFPDVQYLHKICASLYLFLQCAIFAQDCTYFPDVQYLHKICARLYLFLQCAIYAQYCTYFLIAHYMRKICTRLYFFPQCFSNAQYMRKICARLYLFPQCARLYLFPQCAIYEQDLRKIVLRSPLRNICARFTQDCTYFSNA